MRELTVEDAVFVIYNVFFDVGGYDISDKCGMLCIIDSALKKLNEDGYILVKKESGEWRKHFGSYMKLFL